MHLKSYVIFLGYQVLIQLGLLLHLQLIRLFLLLKVFVIAVHFLRSYFKLHSTLLEGCLSGFDLLFDHWQDLNLFLEDILGHSALLSLHDVDLF